MTDRRALGLFAHLAILFAASLFFAGGCGSSEAPKPGDLPAAAANNSADVGSKADQPDNAAPTEKSSAATSTTANSNSTSASSAGPTAAESKPEEPFTPPATLAELDKQVEWDDRPVLDSMKLLEDYLAQQKPLVSVQECSR